MSGELKLKNCPFCGGRAYIAEQMNTMYIECDHESFCGVRPNTWLHSGKTLEQQIKEWNIRQDDELTNVAYDVIKDKKKWGKGWEQKYKLLKAGYDYDEIQDRINTIMNSERR